MSAYKHNRRTEACKNADSNKTPQNRILIGRTDANYVEVYNEICSNVIKLPPEPIALDFVIGVNSNEKAINSRFTVDSFCELVEKWTKETFSEHVIDLVCHLDEHAPHTHLLVAPVTLKDTLSSRSYFYERGGLVGLQTNLAERLADLGIRRGLQGSVGRNAPIQKFYGEINQEKTRTLPPLQPVMAVGEYYEIAQRAFVSRYAEIIAQYNALKDEIKREVMEYNDLLAANYRGVYELSAKEYLSRFERVDNLRQIITNNSRCYEEATSFFRAINNNLVQPNDRVNDQLFATLIKKLDEIRFDNEIKEYFRRGESFFEDVIDDSKSYPGIETQESLEEESIWEWDEERDREEEPNYWDYGEDR